VVSQTDQPAATEPLLQVNDLRKYYDDGDSVVDRLLGTTTPPVKAVDGVSFDIARGETLGVVGESGCGKSTLGRTLMRLVEPTGGEVLFEGEDVLSMDKTRLKQIRKKTHLIFQDPFASLNPRLTVREIVREPLDIHDEGTPAERDERVRELLELVGLSADQVDRYPHEFSGGQRQRVSIARALSLEPELIVLDEPVSALDVSVQAQILNLLSDLQDELGLTYCFIAHDLSVVRFISDYVAIMYLGKIVEIGETEAVYTNPSHPYTKALLDNIPRPSPEEYHRDVDPISGTVPSPRDPPSGCSFHTRCPSLIPPEEYDLEQDEWRAVADFRERMLNDDARQVMETLREETGTPTKIDDLIRDRWDIPETLTDDDAEAALSRAIQSINVDRMARARSTLEEAFVSPCERTEPELTDTGGSESACLLHE
jgi:peptide/nickel transport system ATP-binding protein